MSIKTIERTPTAYGYPLLIKTLLENPVRQFPDQEIVYGDFKRQSYRETRERIGRLASGLAELGVRPGDTVAVMDWDSHRYLECFFAVPMLGAVLHTINIRLSPEQILYTINHAEDDVILVNTEFLPILEAIRDRIEPDLRFNLFHYLAIASNSLQELPLQKNKGILENILYLGMNRKTEEIITRVEKKKRI